MSKSGAIVAKIGLDDVSFHGGSAIHTLASLTTMEGIGEYMEDPIQNGSKVLKSLTMTGSDFLDNMRDRNGLFLAVQAIGMEKLSVLETLISDYIDMCDGNNPQLDEDLKVTLELYY